MTDAVVAITDYLLATECGVFVALLRGREVRLYAVFFGATAVASLAGGAVHGFAPDSRWLWIAVLLALGVTSFACWSLAAALLLPRFARAIQIAAAIELALYSIAVLAGRQNFSFAVMNYLPAVLALLVAFAVRWARTRTAAFASGAAGLIITLLASYLQQRGVGIHPVYFNHNALYHGLEALALFLIFRAARAGLPQPLARGQAA